MSISVSRAAFERWRRPAGHLGLSMSQLVEVAVKGLPDPPPRLTPCQRRRERWRNISISRAAFNRFLPLAAARGTTVSRAAEQSLRAMLFPGGPDMSMPNLTAFPPDAKETRALERARAIVDRATSGALPTAPSPAAARQATAEALIDALTHPALTGFWQRVKESAAWHDTNDAAQAADAQPRKLSGI